MLTIFLLYFFFFFAVSYLFKFIPNKNFFLKNFKLFFFGFSKNSQAIDLKNKNNGSTSINFDKKLVGKYMLLSQQIKKLVTVKRSSITILQSFNEKITKSWPIRFAGSSVLKYINSAASGASLIFFLRKNKSFIKGRYSKNRAYYRTGVYWCLYIHAIAILAFYYWFYRFTLNFGYLWWMFFIFVASFVFAKFLKIDGFDISSFFITFFKNIEWFFFIIYGLAQLLITLISDILNFFKKSKISYYFFFLKNNLFYNYVLVLLTSITKGKQ